MNIIVDNFLERPDLVLEFANSLEYKQNNNNYPGVRTPNLADTHPEFYSHVVEKVLALITADEYQYTVSMHFQKVPNGWSSGIVHKDSHYNGIIYLNKNDNAGTSIKRLKKIYSVYDANSINETFATNDYETNNAWVQKQNEDYETTINVKGLFNRLFLFDGEQSHSANKFQLENAEEGEERLMLILFINNLHAKYDITKEYKKINI